ncbi:putative lumazine-binding protein [Aquimarina sp. MAR_2010_214]|uniref:nuclear transport factor 2 family protein n=1 Tax=Aquimarina sp. MAR_2010_214 TaxID=1250026 RepID=UPI000C703111|nr:nuclear transport factor 2 family protein [Aquimarina sp. MAR_2010_214]PKV51305.1 putative lumazine-binding protein [Aquimarina sp. MAR_2010_214]
MKHLLFITLLFCFFSALSQNKNDSIAHIKQQLLMRNYHNMNQNRVIDYDKSFVSDDKLFYESLTRIPEINYSFSEKEMIEKTLKKYITGSSYNDLEKLESAFATDATLYLTVRGTFKKLTPTDYFSFFKNKKKGVFSGRKGNILSIDIYHDIATAKVEIFIPDGNLKLMDLFLLKKLKGDWKIISKTATRL